MTILDLVVDDSYDHREEAKEELELLRRALKETRLAATDLLKTMDEIYKSPEYFAVWSLYATHFGDYLANGGKQWTVEKDILAYVLHKYKEVDVNQPTE